MYVIQNKGGVVLRNNTRATMGACRDHTGAEKGWLWTNRSDVCMQTGYR